MKRNQNLMVAAWLLDAERTRLEMALPMRCELAVAPTIQKLRTLLESGTIESVVLSSSMIEPPDIHVLAGLVRDYPTVPFIGALVSEATRQRTMTAALRFGRAGVTVAVDTLAPDGWRKLTGRLERRVIPELGNALCRPEYTDGWCKFIRAVFESQSSVRKVAQKMGILPSSLMSRFFRHGLPAPKTYSLRAGLVWAATLAEDRGMSNAAIATALGASSPQSFGRTVKTVTGLTFLEYRQKYNGARALDEFRVELIEPYDAILRTFDPVRSTVGGNWRTRKAAL